MRLLRFFWTRKKQQKEQNNQIVPTEKVTLNQEELAMFHKIKDKPVKLEKEFRVIRVSKDKQLAEGECFVFPDGTKITSLGHLRDFVAGLSEQGFLDKVRSKAGEIKKWVAQVFEQPVLAALLAESKSKQEFLSVLENSLKPNIVVEELEARDEGFHRKLDALLTKYNQVKELVREARRQGVNTFISQTKLLNIKPKIDYATLVKDEDELAHINAKLDEILQELEEEKRIKKEEDENAIY